MATNLQACLQHRAAQAVPPHLWAVFYCSCIMVWGSPDGWQLPTKPFPPCVTIPEDLALPLPTVLCLSSHSGCHQLRRTTLHLPQTLAPPCPPSVTQGPPAALPVHRGAGVSPEAARTQSTWQCRRCLSFPSWPCAPSCALTRGGDAALTATSFPGGCQDPCVSQLHSSGWEGWIFPGGRCAHRSRTAPQAALPPPR